MKLDDLRLHADIISADGHKIGHLSRFVFEPESRKLTHIVVDTGILRSGEALWKGGWGLSHDRIIPIGVLDSADSRAIRITMTGDEFRELSHDYLEEYFKPIPDLKKGEPDFSDVARFAASIPGEPGPYMMQQQTALPPNEAEVHDDSPVWNLNPHKKVGEVERVVFDEASRKITALVVRRGFLFSKEVVLPIADVLEVVGGIVRVQMTDDALHALAEYQPED